MTEGRGVRIAAVVAAAVVVWLAAGELLWPARAFTVLLVVVLPPLAVAQAAVAEEDLSAAPRIPLYLTSAAVLAVLGALAYLAAAAGGIGRQAIGLVPLAPATLAGWSAGVTLATLVLVWLGRLAGIRESPVLVHLLPQTTAERLTFIALALAAGIGEELAFRGFLIAALTDASGSTAFAVILAATLFGIFHAYQRAAGVVRAAVLGLLLTVPLLVTGSLLPSIIAHFTYDVVAGIWLGRWLVRR